MNQTLIKSLLAASLALGLTACGGGDDPALTPETKLSGNIIKGPVKGSTVKIFTADGKELASTTTKDDGSYSVTVSYNGDVVVEAKGGTYMDEATAKETPLGQLKAIAALKGGDQKVVVTPLTYLGYQVAVGNGGIKSDGFAKAMEAIATQFKLTANELAATPVVTATGNNAYGQVLRAFSKAIETNTSEFALDELIGNMSDKTKFAGTAAAFSTAFNAINGTSISYSFSGDAWTIAVGGGGGATGGTGSLTVTGQAAGVAIPPVTISNIPKPANQSEFCGGLENDSTFKGFEQAGAQFTVNSCTFANNVAQINATLTTQGFNIPYNLTYTYN